MCIVEQYPPACCVLVVLVLFIIHSENVVPHSMRFQLLIDSSGQIALDYESMRLYHNGRKKLLLCPFVPAETDGCNSPPASNRDVIIRSGQHEYPSRSAMPGSL